MPKIKNERYKTFFDTNKEFEEYSIEEFEENLNQIKYENPFKQEQARALAIALFYTGLRGTEILSLRPHHIDKKRKDIHLLVKAAKNGLEGTIVLPSDKLTREFYDYAKKLPPQALIFTDFISQTRNIPRYNRYNRLTKEFENIKGNYSYTSHNLYYFCTKWFGVPSYYFRHSRFTSMVKNGATIEEVRLAKLGKTDSSTRAYVKYDVVDATKRKKYYPKKN